MKRGLVGVQADGTEVWELSGSRKRLRVQPDDVAASATQAGLSLLDLPDLVLFELCRWLEWDDAVALAATSCAARAVVVAHHSLVRVVLLELVPLVAHAVASVSLRQPLAGAAPAQPEEDRTREPRPMAGAEPDLATGAEMALEALAQQIGARRHQLRIEQRHHWSGFDTADGAIVRAVRQSVVVRSHAKRGFDAKDKLVMCILEVKLPTLDAAAHETYILNMVHSVSGRHHEDADVTAQAVCRRSGDPAEPSLLFGYRYAYYFGESDGVCQLDTELLNRFAKALHLPLDPQDMADLFTMCAAGSFTPTRCESGQYTPEELHEFREEPLLAPPASIRLDLSHQLCSPAFLRRLARWIKAWRYQLRLAQAYDLALALGSVAPGDVEQVLPHILRGQGKCIKEVKHREPLVLCQANIHLAVPGEEGWLMLDFALDTCHIKLLARASSEALTKRFHLAHDRSGLTYHGQFTIGRKKIWEARTGRQFLAEVARTYGLERVGANSNGEDNCDFADKKEEDLREESDNRLRVLAVLFVCALAAAPQYSLPSRANTGDKAEGAVPFGICMLQHRLSHRSVAGNTWTEMPAFLGLVNTLQCMAVKKYNQC